MASSSSTTSTTPKEQVKVIVCVIIKVHNDVYIRYDISNNWVRGIREFLMDVPLTAYLTNYSLVLEKNGKILEDNESLFDIGINDYDVIMIKPCLYTKTKTEFHIARLKYLLNEYYPCFNVNGYINPKIIMKDKEKLINETKAFYNKVDEIKEEIIKDKQQQDNANTKTDEATKLFEECINNFAENQQKIKDTDFLTLHFKSYPSSALYDNITQSKQKKYKCVHTILTSLSNQIAAASSYLSYTSNPNELIIEITTLENKTLYITCNEHGFYINNTQMKDNLLYIDNTPNKQYTPSYTLVSLLNQASPLFKENFTKLITQVINNDQIFQCASPNFNFNWLNNNQPRNNEITDLHYEYTFRKFNKEDYEHIKLNKEWNEEFFTFLDIQFANDNIQNITKEKLLYEFYSLFKQYAIEGVKLIKTKQLSPFSFFESPKTNDYYYMYNNIIFTILDDSYLTNRTYSQDELKQTYLGSNLDLKHVNYLNKNRFAFNIKHLYFPLNCIVQYMGLRCHCQVITPGVIFNSEHLVQYGESQEGTVKYNESFHKEVEQMYNVFNIKTVNIVDKKGNDVVIYGNPEIKGVVGVDQRKYLFDLIHLFPRDMNYYIKDNKEYNENNRGCLIRPELIVAYKEMCIRNKMKEIAGDNNNNTNTNATNDDNKDKDERIKLIKQGLDMVNKEIEFDTTFGIEFKQLQIKRNDDSLNEYKQLKLLSDFLLKDTIDKFISEMYQDIESESAIIDCFSLSNSLHKYGINCRYLGEIYNRINEDNWLRCLIERDIIRRCAKHIYNEIISGCPLYIVKAITCHILNVIFAPYEMLLLLNDKVVTYVNNEICFESNSNNKSEVDVNKNSNTLSNVNETTVSSNANNQKKKKNKKKNKNKSKQNKDDDNNNNDSILQTEMNIKSIYNDIINDTLFTSDYIESNDKMHSYFLTPEQFWNKIKQIAKQHFNFIFPNNDNINNKFYIDSVLNKHGLLRDFCKTIGISIESNDYSLSDSLTTYQKQIYKKNFSYSFLPFKETNIIDFYPITKDYILPSEIHSSLLDSLQTISKNTPPIEAQTKYRQLIYTSNEIYGPVNKYSGNGYKKLAEIAFLEQDYVNGISCLNKAITIYEKLYEWDCNDVINCYSLLSSFSHFLSDNYMSFVFIRRALEISYYTMPRNHPELITKYISIGMYYFEQEMFDMCKRIVDICWNICGDFYNEKDVSLQRPLLFISQLNLKCFDVDKAIEAYEKYIGILNIKKVDENVLKIGNTVLKSLNSFKDEIKKINKNVKNNNNNNSAKNEMYHQLMNQMIDSFYWDDLERLILMLIEENKLTK